MSLIIDGYNLMYAAGIIAHGPGQGSLERSRLALLNFIAETVDESELATTTVVFDAAAAPPGLPRTLTYRGVTVQFSSGYNDADELIEELILKSTSPKRLTVVSSDHRLHRAARRRKAQAIDSDRWHAQVVAQRNQASDNRPAAPQKPPTPVATSEVEFWLKKFAEPTKAPSGRARRSPTSAPPTDTPSSAAPPAAAPISATSPAATSRSKSKSPPAKSTKAAQRRSSRSKSKPAGKPPKSLPSKPKRLLAGDDVFPQEYLDSIDEE